MSFQNDQLKFDYNVSQEKYSYLEREMKRKENQYNNSLEEIKNSKECLRKQMQEHYATLLRDHRNECQKYLDQNSHYESQVNEMKQTIEDMKEEKKKNEERIEEMNQELLVLKAREDDLSVLTQLKEMNAAYQTEIQEYKEKLEVQIQEKEKISDDFMSLAECYKQYIEEVNEYSEEMEAIVENEEKNQSICDLYNYSMKLLREKEEALQMYNDMKRRYERLHSDYKQVLSSSFSDVFDSLVEMNEYSCEYIEELHQQLMSSSIHIDYVIENENEQTLDILNEFVSCLNNDYDSLL